MNTTCIFLLVVLDLNQIIFNHMPLKESDGLYWIYDENILETGFELNMYT